MSAMQQVILDSYFESSGKKSLRKIAEDTGIQMTRVFRILNGAEMKVSEFEKFQKAVDRSKNQKVNLESLILESKKYMTESMASELGEYIERLLFKRKLYLGVTL